MWTQRDPEKRKIARKNNLNFIEIFPDDNIDLIVTRLCEIKKLKTNIKV